MATTKSITVERAFKASPEKVFDAWLSPELIGQWMFGPSVREETVVHLKNDPVAGGTFSFKVLRDGTAIDHIGTYLVIERPHHLSFTWNIAGFPEDESVVDIRIRETEEGCALTLTHGVWAEYAERTQAGWNFMLEKLDSILPDTEDKVYVKAQMMIRKPVATVFEAFINPDITRHFWFTRGSARLEAGRSVLWEWEMYGVSSPVRVLAILSDEKIIIDWGEPATRVIFGFRALAPDQTYVEIRQSGLQESGEELLAQVNDLTGGFTTVLDGLKAYLEHGINLNLVADKFPREAGQP